MAHSIPEYHADQVNDGGYTSIILGMDPVAYFPLNEASDNDPMQELRGLAGQAYVNSPNYQFLNAIRGESSRGVQFDGVNEYGNLSTLGNLGSNAGSGLCCIFWYRATVSTTAGDMFGVRVNGGGMSYRVLVNFNSVSGRCSIFLRDENGNTLQGTINQPAINDGNMNLIHVEILPPATINFRFNNAQQTVSYTAQNAPFDFINFAENVHLGGANLDDIPSRFVNSAYSHLAFWNRALTVAERQSLYLGAA